jgi:3-oxoacyl-[acyl-carrier-protein] synthase-3
MGWALPKNEITNGFLHDTVGLERDQHWVDSRLGIEKRYSVLTRDYIVQTKNKDPMQAILHARAHGETTVTLASRAGKMALDKAGLRPNQIGMVLINCDTPFDLVPSAATAVAKALGIPGGPHMELNSACSSFALHMHYLGQVVPEKLPEYILTIQAAAYTTRVDYSAKHFDGYIWGDGAAAQVVSAKRPGRLKVEPLIYDTGPEQANEISVDTTGHFTQNGALVREFSIRKTCEMYEQIAHKKELYADEVYTVSHQANYVMQNSILGHLHLPEDKHIRNVREQGNIGAAGCPSAIAQYWDKLKAGDKIVYAVLGAGLAWGGGYMEVQ